MLSLDAANLSDQFTACVVLRDEAVGSGGQRFLHEAAGAMLGEEDDFDMWERVLDEARGFEAANDGHGDIHEDEVGLVLFGVADGVSAVRSFADDFDIGVGLKNFADRPSDDIAVVDDQDTKGRYRH